MAELDPLRLPLRGRRLIEASAGTGKTYAIGSLVLRAVLGHGDETPLRLDRILVVTFTRAATLELRDRIRVRLVAARDAFEARTSDDPFLAALLEECPDHERGAMLFAAALGQLDEAAVFTIHGFCQRILQESAFESGAVFEQDFVLDDSEYQQRAARDFWRREVYPLEAGLSAVVREQWPDPDALLRAVRGHLARPALVVRGADARPLSELGRDAVAALHEVKRVWRTADVRARIEASRVSGSAKGPGGVPMLDAMDAWASTDEETLVYAAPDGSRAAITKLLGAYVEDVLVAEKNLNKKGAEPDFEDFFAALAPALDALARLPVALAARALDAIREGAEEEKRADHMIAPDDVLRQTAQGLRGARGPAFAARVRASWPLAFIDEFQDTDPLQYEIFDALYPAAAVEELGALVMIGDPKQAIYGFRGADIHAYLQARETLPPDGRVEMDTNWRSSPEMLAAVAALYEGCSDPFASPDIQFIDVAARPGARPGQWRRGGEAAPALTFWHLPAEDGVLATNKAHAALAATASATIAELIAQDTQIGDDRLRPGDVTVLVADRFEAEAMRRALAERRIACVWQSREPVFATAMAADLRLLLAGVLDPRDERGVRSALATQLIGLELAELHRQTLGDDALWQVHLDRFARYHDAWRDRGVMVMLRMVLADYAVPARMLAAPEGARQLTDLRHLGELLQHHAVELGSMHRLLRWFAREVDAPDSDETSQLRLESDGDLVKIATVHGAKGLEYPVVMLPFGIRYRPARDALFHERIDGQWRLVLDLLPDEDAMARADEERIAEDLRLLYVALTRARHACFVGIANFARGNGKESVLHHTALGHLLFGPGSDPLDDGRIAARLEALTAACEEVAVVIAGDDGQALAPGQAPLEAVARRREFSGRIERDWTVTSYTALVAHESVPGLLAPGAQDETHAPVVAGDEAEQAPAPIDGEAPAGESGRGTAARFPRGARPGSCLHDLLERWPGAVGEELEHVTRTLTLWGFDDRQEAPPEGVLAWLRAVRRTPLGIGADLASVDHALAEMEFHLPLGGLDSGALQALLGAHGYVADPLARTRVEGMLRGFVDLVVEHEGRYWIIDYKSNWLGDAAADYEAPALSRAIREHRYDLQFLLYSVALRRLLRLRLADPEAADERFGGVLYLFLRGMDGSGTRGIYRHRPERAVLDAIEACFEGRAA
ncbi:MAG TPA: exodeoxyribonuclease V subunit beta [Pseudomonadales bacterium]|nr:exodeoxyribonuclease V subunit beta [Pseudomonadales bacterium]